jgi:hypothetical protein
MDIARLIELERTELGTLEEFLETLKTEREAIISFSLEGVIRENNRKEEIIKKLELIEAEKQEFFEACPNKQAIGEEMTSLFRQSIEGKMKEVKLALERNMGLLSFSMDHVRSSIEKIIGFVNRSSYDKGRSISIAVSRKV